MVQNQGLACYRTLNERLLPKEQRPETRPNSPAILSPLNERLLPKEQRPHNGHKVKVTFDWPSMKGCSRKSSDVGEISMTKSSLIHPQ